MYVLVCESESEIVSVSVLSLRWWQAHIARLQTVSKAAAVASSSVAEPPPPPKAAPTPLIPEQQEDPEPPEEEEEDADEEVDGAVSLARAAMAVGEMRAAGALKMKITIHTFRVRVLG